MTVSRAILWKEVGRRCSASNQQMPFRWVGRTVLFFFFVVCGCERRPYARSFCRMREKFNKQHLSTNRRRIQRSFLPVVVVVRVHEISRLVARLSSIRSACVCILNEWKAREIPALFSLSPARALSSSCHVEQENERERSKYKIMFRFLSLPFILAVLSILSLCTVCAVRAPCVLYHLCVDLGCRPSNRSSSSRNSNNIVNLLVVASIYSREHVNDANARPFPRSRHRRILIR